MVKQIKNKEFLTLTKQIGMKIRGKLSGRIVQKLIRMKKEITTCLKLKNRTGHYLNLPLNLYCLGKLDGTYQVMNNGSWIKLDSKCFSEFKLKANRIHGHMPREITRIINRFIKHYPKINIFKIVLEQIMLFTQFPLMHYDPYSVFDIFQTKGMNFLALCHKENAFSWIFFGTVKTLKLIVIHLFVTHTIVMYKGFGKELMSRLQKLYPGWKYIVESDANEETVKFYQSIGFMTEENCQIPSIYKRKIKKINGTILMFCESLKIKIKCHIDYTNNYFSSVILFNQCASVRRFFEVLFFLLYLITDCDIKVNIFLSIRKIIDLVCTCSCSNEQKLNSCDFILNFINLLQPIVEVMITLKDKYLRHAENIYRTEAQSINDTRTASDWIRVLTNN